MFCKPEHSISLCNSGKKTRLNKRGEPEKEILNQKLMIIIMIRRLEERTQVVLLSYFCLRILLYSSKFLATVKTSLFWFHDKLALQLSNLKDTLPVPPENICRKRNIHTKRKLWRKRESNCVGCYQKLRSTMKSKDADKKVAK